MITNQNPFVTVLMPVYNAEAYLVEAINSILKQTYTNFEYIIIDDGSTDESNSIIKSFSDSRIKLFENGKNIKLIATLNKGIDLAQGKYIARMDADDISLPERLEKQVNFMENNPQVGLCGSFVKTIGIEKNYEVQFKTTHDEIKFKLFFDTHFPHPAVILRTSVLRENNLKFDTAYLHAEDFALWNAMANITQLAVIPEILVLKRSHKDQISHKFTDIQHTVSSKIRKELLNKLGLNPKDDTIEIYDRFLFKEYPANQNDLFSLLDFFNKMIEANHKVKVYDINLFDTYFAVQYWNLCCCNTKYGMALYKEFFRSQPAFILNLTFFTKIKFFIKVLFRYGNPI